MVLDVGLSAMWGGTQIKLLMGLQNTQPDVTGIMHGLRKYPLVFGIL
jgi:hypothetical protein